MTNELLYAEWTEEQIANLESYQQCQYVHPYTCICGESLIPYKEGWECDECGYHQNWCLKSIASMNWTDYNPFSALISQADEEGEGVG